jgi:hypothetical protein
MVGSSTMQVDALYIANHLGYLGDRNTMKKCFPPTHLQVVLVGAAGQDF